MTIAEGSKARPEIASSETAHLTPLQEDAAGSVAIDARKELQEECRTDFDGRCIHCGLPSSEPFCCMGCESVHETLLKLGLTEYYRWRSPRPAPVKHAPAQCFADLAAISLTPAADGLVSYDFTITGIHCAGCLWLLERLPEIQSGISGSSLNFSTGELTVRFNPALISLAGVGRLLDRLGYPPHAPQPTDERELSNRTDAIRIGVAGFASLNTMLLAVALFEGFFTGIEAPIASLFRWISFAIATPAVMWAAQPLMGPAFRAALHRTIHIELPLSIAIASAYLLSGVNTILERPYVYFDSVCLLIFLLLVGRGIQGRAVERAQREARLGWALLPASARRQEGDHTTTVPIEQIIVGDLLVVKPGERFPADGIVMVGDSSADLSILTGESRPVALTPGAGVTGGSLNLSGEIVLQVRSLGEHSRVGKLLKAVRSASHERGSITRFTDAVGRWYLYGLASAALAAVVLNSGAPHAALEAVMTLCIVSCPCALAFATPTVLGCAIGAASRRGIIVKSPAVFERLTGVRTAYFDKTGTLTSGSLSLVGIDLLTPDRKVEALSILEILTGLVPSHPISSALRRAFRFTNEEPSTARLIVGRGVELVKDHVVWRLGTSPWAGPTPEVEDGEELLTTVSLSRGGEVIARFRLADELRPDTARALKELTDMGISATILSGDEHTTAAAVGEAAGVSRARCYGGLTPHEKAAFLTHERGASLFVGDGVNDTLALRAADIGIAFANGLEATAETADIVVTDASLAAVTELVREARRMRRTILGILTISVLYNLCAGAAAVLGRMNPLIAAFLMPTSSTISLLLALGYRPFAGFHRSDHSSSTPSSPTP